MNTEDRVTKRDGKTENISFDKILKRLKALGKNELNVNYTGLVQKVIDRLYDKISTSLIDELTAQQCASLATTHPDYGVLASRILISNHHKNTNEDILVVATQLYEFKDIHEVHHPIISNEQYKIILEHHKEIQSMIDYERDYYIDYFGFKTLERAYLLRINKVIIERPQQMWMRVAIGIHKNNMDKVRETYNYMSEKYFTHATPTLFNAGTPRPQLSSCYLIAMESDSIKGIYNTLSDCAAISKWAGGIGLHVHNVRAAGSHIRGTNGTSNGLVPMLRVFNNTARYVDQGGGKRHGSFAIYLEPWHGDIFEFLEMKKNHGDEEMRARDLFYALWIPDLFMKRVAKDADWTLMCPDVCPGLSDCYGEKFEELYTKYESEGKGIKTIKARDVWFKILDSQMETGTPYMLYKDACNSKSNQKNLGTIKSSNLCTEIVEYSNDEETAVCNLASIALSKFTKKTTSPFTKSVTVYTKENCKWCDLLKYLLNRKNIEYNQVVIEPAKFEDYKKEFNVETLPLLLHGEEKVGGYDATLNLLRDQFDYELLHKVTKVVTRNLNNVIDINYYPTDKTKNSNMKHRPIGIGVQGLADAFAIMDVSFHSNLAKQINRNIFETMYHAALEASMEAAQQEGPYSTFKGSPASQGILQFDMWNVTPSSRYDWDSLKLNIAEHGLRNSLLLAPMPTASTSQILGNNECFEPFTSNIYVRRTIAGEFVCINKFLLKELIDLGLWTDEIKNSIIRQNGSVQNVKGIPKGLQEKYKIVWEIPMKHLLEMSADRGAFICQSQSTNLWMKEPSYKKLTAMHMFAWKKGLKTGIYYLRTKAKAAPQQFTIEPDKKTSNVEEEEDCLMCGS
ncbi:MAG: ribonucleoside-diphosphate reductase subunit alpha [Flavobacteriales bacterium]|nr:ribonucleoside-diphosphate reductase subunit alpha [Flavobacteriales bacterium]